MSIPSSHKAVAGVCLVVAIASSVSFVIVPSRQVADIAQTVSAVPVHGPIVMPELDYMLPDGGTTTTTTTTTTPPPVVATASLAPVNPKPAPVPAHKPVQPPAPTEEVAPPPPSGDVSATIEAVIAFAQAQHGDAYVWGGNGPDGWDCSGLVQAAFRSVGISLPRTTWDMVNRGIPVSRGQLQRGDLVFMESIGHMGIYVGGNMMVNAASGRTMAVVTSSLYAFDAGRRIIY